MQDTVTERIMWGAVDIGTPKKNIHFVSRLMVLLKVSWQYVHQDWYQ